MISHSSAAGPRDNSGISITVEDEDVDDAGLSGKNAGELPALIAGEWRGVTWPEPAVFPDSISKASRARTVEREREQPKKT